MNIHSVAKYQKLMGGTIKKISEKNQSHSAEKRRKVSVSKKVDPSALEWLFIMLEALDALKMNY